jgi:hypothetical protein
VETRCRNEMWGRDVEMRCGDEMQKRDISSRKLLICPDGILALRHDTRRGNYTLAGLRQDKGK